MNEVWDHDEWGDPKDYGVDPNKTALGGFEVGQRVRFTQDYEDDGLISGYEDDEAIVVGITKPTAGGGPFNLPAHGDRLAVCVEGMEPVSVDPSALEIVEE